MGGVKALRKLQIGLEGTSGTAVPATTIWRGENMLLSDDREVIHPPENVGIVTGVDRAYVPYLAGSLSMSDHEATFEQLPYILSAGMKDVVTGAADGAGTGKIYAYPLPTTALNAIKTYTLEAGDNQEAEVMEYGFVKSFSISGKSKESLKVSAEWGGRQVGLQAFTGALSIPTVEEMLFQKMKLYIDPTSTHPATTQKTTTLLSFSLACTTGWTENYTGDGNLYFSNVRFDGGAFELMLNVTFEHDATAAAEKVAWRAGTSRSVKLLCEGSANTTPGTAYSKKTFIANLLGKWEKFEKLDEQNGNDIVTGTLRCRYNATAASAGGFIVVAELASLA